jgi:hypothetical protein
MTAPKLRRWAVVYQSARRRPLELWMLVEDVPAAVTRVQVWDALEAAPFWPHWQRRIAPGARLDLRTERSWTPVMRADVEGRTSPATSVTTMTWAELEPEIRRLSIPVDAALYAAVRRTAAGAGQSMQAWAADALRGAVAAAALDANADGSP